MKLNVVLGAAVVAGAMTSAGSTWAGDGPAPAAAAKAHEAHKADKAAPNAEHKPGVKADKAEAKADKAEAKADKAEAKAEALAAKPEGAGAPAKPEVSKEALEARDTARDAYRKLWADRRAAREAAIAGKTPEEAKKAAQEVDAKFDEQIRDSRAKLWTAQRAANGRPALTPEQIAARGEKLAKLTEKEHKDRDQRRKAYLAPLEKAHGKKLENPALQNELRRHAWRVARLDRLATIAEASERTELVAKITELKAKEDKHHTERLAQLAKVADVAAAAPADAAKPAPAAGTPAATPAAAAPAAAPAAAAPAAAPAAPKGAQ